MNKYQRIVVIAAGALIALIQIIGIGKYGLDDSKGWAVSFLISAALLFVGFGSWDGIGAFSRRATNEKSLDTNRGQGETSQREEKVLVDILYGSVFKNAQDFYQYIKSKGYYHPSGPLALLLKPDVYSWFVGYAALYVLCLTSEKYRAKAAQMFVVRNLVLREVVTSSTELWKDLDAKILRDAGKVPTDDDSSVADQAATQERKIFEDHIQSLEDACREAIKNITVNRAAYPYLPIYRVIGPVFGGIQDMDAKQLAERFNPIFGELLKKTGNVLNAL